MGSSVRPSTALRTDFTYSPATGRYRYTASGRFVTRSQVEEAIAGVVRGTAEEARRLAIALQEDRISLDLWRASMRDLVKDAHLYQAALAKGGWAQLTPADLGRLGPELRFHYARLERFVNQLADGLPTNGSFFQRVEMYMNMARPSYYTVREQVEAELGNTMEYNILGPKEHCEGCLEATALGKVPVGTLPKVGTRPCKANCSCRIGYTRPD